MREMEEVHRQREAEKAASLQQRLSRSVPVASLSHRISCCPAGRIGSIESCCGSITSVADPGSGAFLTPGSGIGKKSGSGYGMNNPDHISESLETIFWVKILKFFYVVPGSGVEKFWIRDPG